MTLESSSATADLSLVPFRLRIIRAMQSSAAPARQLGACHSERQAARVLTGAFRAMR
jgi:hypothetical protein